MKYLTTNENHCIRKIGNLTKNGTENFKFKLSSVMYRTPYPRKTNLFFLDTTYEDFQDVQNNFTHSVLEIKFITETRITYDRSSVK